jgi:2-alkyl-3-oxoalkanoate reductase
MRVFLAGATGVIGRRLLPMLVGAGHEVTAMTRREEGAAALRQAGAVTAICDVFDADAVAAAMQSARPEVVVHELTDLPTNLDPRKLEEQTAGNDRIRTEGTLNLVKAACAAGARRMVAQSIAFAYPPGGGIRHEEDPLWDEAPWPWSRSVKALRELENAVVNTGGLEGLVLRYGWFYGPGSAYASDGHFAGEARKRRLPVVGSGTGIFSFIHVDDAAGATLIAVERGAPGIYNIVDDEPAPMREWVPAYAAAMGAKPPRHVPVWLARLIGGRYAANMSTALSGASNEKAKSELGWAPRYASWRQGFREAPG